MFVKKGDTIFKQGEKGRQAYLIEEGQVEIYHTLKDGQETPLAVIGQGELFGEMALIDSNFRSASTRALTDCSLLVIEKGQLVEKLNSSDVVVQLMMRVLIQRLRHQNQSKSGILLSEISTDLNTGDAVEKLKLENQIYQAFKNNEFVIYHQPIFNFAKNKVTGSEALIRWDSPSKGIVSPVMFVDVLENSSMIVPIGYWIFEECFRQYKMIKTHKPDLDFSMSINVSARQFIDPHFINQLETLYKKHNVPPQNFKLEITERILMEGGLILDLLAKCKEHGFAISLDDFGTGFSSLQYLSQMPIDFLKIDRTFVMNIQKDPKTEAVVSSIIFLAKKLNLKIISEGIESQTEEAIMRVLGCDYGQGYYYSKPQDIKTFLNTIEG